MAARLRRPIEGSPSFRRKPRPRAACGRGESFSRARSRSRSGPGSHATATIDRAPGSSRMNVTSLPRLASCQTTALEVENIRTLLDQFRRPCSLSLRARSGGRRAADRRPAFIRRQVSRLRSDLSRISPYRVSRWRRSNASDHAARPTPRSGQRSSSRRSDRAERGSCRMEGVAGLRGRREQDRALACDRLSRFVGKEP